MKLAERKGTRNCSKKHGGAIYSVVRQARKEPSCPPGEQAT